MVSDLKAAAEDGSQSSQGSAEEGEEEEAQACDSDGEPADPKPTYADGNPHELIEKAKEGAAADGQRAEGAEGAAADSQKAEGEEGAAADGQRSVPLYDQVLSNIEAHVQEAGLGQVRITAEEVRRWAEVGERVKRIMFYW